MIPCLAFKNLNSAEAEVIMKCGYCGWIIDATPEFCLGKFFARARLVRPSADENVDGDMHIERNLAWFDTAEEAIEAAQKWAFAWIGDRDGSFADGQILPPTMRRDASAQAIR
ncbi:hypothetical protein [Paraburkholderia phytofirmans]|uniref:hypothetical protein n=1 Tax=Paraburkholderia phytofirmans TaxID=261302 RepID=UPI0038B73B9A